MVLNRTTDFIINLTFFSFTLWSFGFMTGWYALIPAFIAGGLMGFMLQDIGILKTKNFFKSE